MKTYIAYGSNMDLFQMEYRCPEANLVGVGEIHGWEMLFKGSLTGFYATIEPKADAHSIPVVVWDINEKDEAHLDYYEGFPTFYYKKEDVEVTMSTGEILTGMAYIMHEERKVGIPRSDYFLNILDIYKHLGWDETPLWSAIQKSKKA